MDNLQNDISKILKSRISKDMKSIKLIKLAEAAWSYGDMTAYRTIVDKVMILNPKSKIQKPFFKTVNDRFNDCLPDIDLA